MRAGNKNKRIEIQSLAISKNSIGENVETWTLFKTVWAEIRQASSRALGKEFFEGGEISELHLTFRIDYIKDLSPKNNRLIYDGDIYDIYSITERGRRQVTEIVARAQGL